MMPEPAIERPVAADISPNCPKPQVAASIPNSTTLAVRLRTADITSGRIRPACDVNSTEVSAQANDDSNAAAAPTHPPPTTGSLGHADGSGPIALATALQAPAAGYEPNTLKKLAC